MELEEFTQSNAPADGGEGFQKENSKILDIHLNGTAMVKAGSMIGYTGEITFAGNRPLKVESLGSSMMQSAAKGRRSWSSKWHSR